MRKRALLLSIIAAGVAGVAAFGWVTIRRGFSARDNPSVVETYVAKTARRLSVLASEGNAKNPFAPTAKVLSEASAHFADHSAICHGNDGSEKTQIGQNLYPKTPDMRLPRHSETHGRRDLLHHPQWHSAYRNARMGHGGERRR